MRVVVTGANGFVGQHLVPVLAAIPGLSVVAAARHANAEIASAPVNIIPTRMPDLSAVPLPGAFEALLTGADVVIHLAAMTPAAAGSSAQLDAVNVAGVTALAKAAHNAGVKQFVLVSSVRVSGATTGLEPITELSPEKRDDAYAASKAAAEAALISCAANSRMAWTIVRPPLVYGPGVKGPMRQLAKAVIKGVPLPFGLVTNNQRDAIGVGNLSEFLALSIQNTAAANQTFVVTDGVAFSTRALIEAIATAAGVKARLLPVPQQVLRAASSVPGPGASLARLIGDSRIDDSKARAMLGWRPPHAPAFDMARMVQRFSSS